MNSFACKTLDEFLDQWGEELGREADASMAPLHVPARDAANLLPLHRKPYPGQAHCMAAAVKALHRQNNVGLICEPGSGKGGLPSTKVLTPTGWTTLGEIKVGDAVVDPATGGETVVTGVFRRGVMPMFRVTMNDGSSTVCSDDHLWKVISPNDARRKNPWKVKTLADIRVKLRQKCKGGHLLNKIPMTSPVAFRPANLPIDPYLLGALIGDGGFSAGSPVFSNTDSDILGAVAARVPAGLSLKRCADVVSHRITHGHGQGVNKKNPLVAQLESLGLWGRKSAAKFIPTQYLFAPLRERLDLLAGLLDTDGSVVNGVAVEYSTTSKQLADDVKFLVASIGGIVALSTKATRYEHNGRKLTGQTCYRMYCRLPRGIAPFRCGRKAQRYRPGNKYPPNRAIASVEPYGDAECICISVASESKLYITDDFIVTHNTLMAAGICHNHANSIHPRRWHKKAGANAPTERKTPARYRALIMCPGHLPKKWQREIERTVPGAIVTIITKFSDVVMLPHAPPPAGPEWFIISKDRAKLSCGWEPAVVDRVKFGREGLRCPSCDAIQEDLRRQLATLEYMARNRRVCPSCGERLWQDVPKPRRYSPALFIKKHMHRFFDYLIVDESHDMKGADTVQADAMGFLSAAAKKTLTLTGTLVGGYAWHVRTALFRVGAAQSLIDQGLGWKDEQAFNERYGRIETTVTATGQLDGQGHRRARGGKRRVMKRVRPGIMPTLFGDHLISSNIFLSLDEVCADLPSFRETLVPVDVDSDILTEYSRIEAALRDEIAAMMFKPGGRSLLGKLLHTLLAYPDYPFKWKEIGYHDEDPETGDEVWVGVVTPKNFDEERLYAKEKALIEHIKNELAEGRKCWVFTTMVGERDAIGRLENLLRAEGIVAKTLRSSIEPIAREEWIEREGPRCDVILSMPELVKTGLDFFDQYGRYNFPSIMFYMTGYNSFTLSQASRRAWRIGQSMPCRVFYFFAKDTMQAIAMELMAKKMAATSAVSGRFSTEGLSAMAGEDDSMEMAMAKALVEKTSSTAETLRAWEKVIGLQEPERKVATAQEIDEIVKSKPAPPPKPQPQKSPAPKPQSPPPPRVTFDSEHTDLFALLDFSDLSEIPQ